MSDIVQELTKYRITGIEKAEVEYYEALTRALDKIEEQISKYVISSNQAMIWDCLRSVNLNKSISGYGKLLSN